MKNIKLLFSILFAFFIFTTLSQADIVCDIVWYRGEGASSGAWSYNIQNALEELEAIEGICWEIIWTAQEIKDGALQNPDGSPKYGVVYFMGGSGREYNNGLGEDGAQMIRDFVSSGGGYIGTCAGAFYGSTNYCGIFPGRANYNSYVGIVDYILNTDSLINEGFGLQLDNVTYYGGCWLEEDIEGVEYVAIYESYTTLDGHPAVTFNNYDSGYVILSGGHPEAGTGSRDLEYFKQLFRYVLGLGEPDLTPPLPPTGLRIVE